MADGGQRFGRLIGARRHNRGIDQQMMCVHGLDTGLFTEAVIPWIPSRSLPDTNRVSEAVLAPGYRQMGRETFSSRW